MAPTPSSTSSSMGGRSPKEQFRVVRKRNRVPLSCSACRTRKKCDRNHPCSNCTKREGEDTTSCSYAAPVASKKSQSHENATPDDMRDRIDRLESLVLLLMHSATANGAPVSATHEASGTPSAADSMADSSSYSRAGHDDSQMLEGVEGDGSDTEDELAGSLGLLKVEPAKGKSMYCGHSHWHTILGDISEVKNYFALHKKELDKKIEHAESKRPNFGHGGPMLLLGVPPTSESELRQELPDKSTMITLCSRYFSSMDNVVGIIHGPSFFNKLKKHWEDPSKTPVMWLGMVYAMLCLAMLSYHKVGDEPPEWRGRTFELAAKYRERTVQCLIKADYTKPVEATVEAMLLYVFGEYSSRWEVDHGLWICLSLTTRIAFRMGYHRDAKWFPSLTPFQAEMRRRTWALVRISDVIFSHQASLPSMIYEHDCDTQLPNNLLDDDFNPDSKELPSPRPPSEPTSISYMITKAKLCNELGNVLQGTNKVGKGMPYEEVIRFDARLRQIMQALPPHLKIAKLEGSCDPITLIVARYNIDILYQKILCLLHRNYLTKARHNPRFALSRRTAISASMQAMNHLAKMHRESQNGGKLRSVAWYVRSTASKDFMLPAMLISLDLHYDNLARQSPSPVHEGNFLYTEEQRRTMIDSLEIALPIWSGLAHESLETWKGAKVLEIMLKKIKEPVPRIDVHARPLTPEPDAAETSSARQSQEYDTALPGTGSGLTDAFAMANFDNNLEMEFAPPPVNGFVDMDFGMSSVNGNVNVNDLDYRMGIPGVAGPQSFPQLSSMGVSGTPGDLLTNFDWGVFENYTTMATWGADQGFGMYSFGGQSEEDPEGMMGVQL